MEKMETEERDEIQKGTDFRRTFYGLFLKLSQNDMCKLLRCLVPRRSKLLAERVGQLKVQTAVKREIQTMFLLRNPGLGLGPGSVPRPRPRLRLRP
ncbi:hypothetical protein HZH66_000110 [Vespula vulgaris]|uniref:Uncharacterized protein n=1 Tax=Vespula vulgaris TaxID=7454 RepID=A0A834NKJ7_VESVU|nr:hypothetical protein HZH66_000110 [Vespula vulgaris]